MQKMQKAGFIISASIFMVVGIILLIAGLATQNLTLRIMGMFWLPLGIVNLLVVLFMLKREENSSVSKDANGHEPSAKGAEGGSVSDSEKGGTE